jgi:transposase
LENIARKRWHKGFFMPYWCLSQKGMVLIMAYKRRNELTDEEWEQIRELLPPERTGKKGKPRKDNRPMFNAMVWLARSGAPWRDLPERFGPWESVYTRFRKWLEDGILDNIFRVLALEAELHELSLDSTIVRAHQHSAGAKKGAKTTKSAEAEAD